MNSLKILILSYRSAPFGGGQGIYVRDLSKSLIDLINLCSCFFEEPNFSDKQSLTNIWTDETHEILTSFILELKKVKIWELEILENTLKEYIKTDL